MFKVVTKSEATVRNIAENKIARNYITKAISPEVSLATTEATDYFEQETSEYNRIYYVTEGILNLVIEGEKISLEEGDACYIGRNTPYEMHGTFKAVIVNQPAFGI
jgi:ethanolamine utilization protein EutQ (cupin superfamily)